MDAEGGIKMAELIAVYAKQLGRHKIEQYLWEKMM